MEKRRQIKEEGEGEEGIEEDTKTRYFILSNPIKISLSIIVCYICRYIVNQYNNSEYLYVISHSAMSNMDCSMPGFPVHHHLPELAQTHVH